MENEGMPWQIKAISILGIPAVIAIYLVYFLVTGVDQRLSAVSNNFELHRIDAQYALKNNMDQTLQLKAMFVMLQQICVNTSKTEKQADNCWNPWSQIR